MVLITYMLLNISLIAQCGLQNEVIEHYVNSNKNGTLIGVPFLKILLKNQLTKLSLTLSRNSLPGLKCGTYLPSSFTVSPVLGLRPTRGAR